MTDKKDPVRALILEEFKFERRKYIFNAVNTVNLVWGNTPSFYPQVLTIYNLISPINIEGQNSLFYYEEADRSGSANQRVGTLLALIATLIVVHYVRVFTCILGYFSLEQVQTQKHSISPNSPPTALRQAPHVLHDAQRGKHPGARHRVAPALAQLRYD